MTTARRSPEPLAHPAAGHSIDSVKTWRYLRLSMVGVVAALAAAVLYEHFQIKERDCFQTSISAYYYTPASSVFVAALVSIGVAMVCLRGSNRREDLLLNLAGMFAPIVAFVPTPGPGTCWSVQSATEARAAQCAWRCGDRDVPPHHRRGLHQRFRVQAAAWTAHILEGVRDHCRRDDLVLAVQLATVVVHWVTNDALWSHQTIVVESLLLGLFAVWAIQTCELWGPGLRPDARSS